METGRHPFRPPVDFPPPGCAFSPPYEEFEQSVIRTNEPAVIGQQNTGPAVAADTGVDDAEKNAASRKPCTKGRQQVSSRFRICGGGISH